MNADKQTLEAIAFDSAEFPNLEDREYSRELHERFGARPYWEALGFVPGEQQEPRSRVSPWKQGSEYDSLYKPGEVKTLHGTIESVGLFRRKHRGEGLRLRIKTEDGETVTFTPDPARTWNARTLPSTMAIG